MRSVNGSAFLAIARGPASTRSNPTFTESLRQEVAKRHVRVGVLEPGEVATELVSHNNENVKAALAVNKNDEPLTPEDIADGIAFMVTRPRHAAIGDCG
jgi:NADP-dependent 3-hydroxy acid dehydrogenase YdfG